MSEFLATAFVQIRPQIRGFKTALAADIKANLGNLQSVPVSVIPKVAKNFQILIREQLALQAVPVPVVPVIDVAKFRAAIQAAVLEATAGVKAVIPVTAGAVTGAGTGAGQATAANEGAAAVTKLTVAEQRLLEQEIALTRIKEASVVATRHVNKALAESTTLSERDALLKRESVIFLRSKSHPTLAIFIFLQELQNALILALENVFRLFVKRLIFPGCQDLRTHIPHAKRLASNSEVHVLPEVLIEILHNTPPLGVIRRIVSPNAQHFCTQFLPSVTVRM